MSSIDLSRINQSIRILVDRFHAVTSWLHADAHGNVTAIVCGALLVLAFAPFGWFPLAVLLPACLMWLIEGVSPRRAALRGFLFGFAEFLWGVYWLYNSIHIVADAPIWVAVLMLVGLSAVMGLYFAATCAIAVLLTPGSGPMRWLVAFPALWALIEWLRGWLLSGFPWLSLGYSQINSGLRGYAPVIGVYGVSMIVMFCAGLILCMFTKRLRLAPRLISLGVFIIVWGLGGMLGTVQWTRPTGQAISVSLIQGDIPEITKWAPQTFAPTMELYERFTEENWGSQLIIWPEAAVPDYYSEVKETYLDPLEHKARMHGTDMLIGVPTEDIAGDYYNSVISLGHHDGVYNKRHLVPFGEYFPVPEWVREWLQLMDLPYSDFTPGASDQPLLKVAGYPVGISICYEDAFSSEILLALPQAAFLVNVSNDGWFGRSIALPQHLEIARMRAVETGRYLLRDTNTGITAIIDTHGKVIKRIPAEHAGVLTSMVEPYAGSTPYVSAGIWPFMCTALILLFGAALMRWRTAQRE